MNLVYFIYLFILFLNESENFTKEKKILFTNEMSEFLRGCQTIKE